MVEPSGSLRRRHRGPSSSASGLRLSSSPPRIGRWMGALPPRRISPPPVLGSFIDKALAGRTRPALVETADVVGLPKPGAAVVTATSLALVAGDPSSTTESPGVGEIQIPRCMGVGHPRLGVDRGRSNPWAYLHRPHRVYPSSAWIRSPPDRAPMQSQNRPRLPPASSSTPASSPSSLPASSSSTPVVPPPCRWDRSFAAVAAVLPGTMAAQLRPHGGDPRVPGPGRPLAPIPILSQSLQRQDAVPGMQQGGAPPSGAATANPAGFFRPPSGPPPFLPLQNPSRQPGLPAFVPPTHQYQFQPPPFMPLPAPVYAPFQQPPPMAPTAGQGPRPKRKKKKGVQQAAVLPQLEQNAQPLGLVQGQQQSMMQQPLPVPPPANVSGQQQVFMPQPAAAPLLAADGVGSASLVDATA